MTWVIRIWDRVGNNVKTNKPSNTNEQNTCKIPSASFSNQDSLVQLY